MNIAVVGTGYVGLVAGACFAESGNDVVCVDTDSSKVEKLKQGIIPIYEPGLKELVVSNSNQGRLRFTTEIQPAVEEASVVFIAVGTPQDEDGSADLQYVLQVAKSVGLYMNKFTVVVNKSTVPVGTAELVRKEIAKHTKQEFEVVSNPEFLKEGSAVQDFLKPDRVVIGTESQRAQDIMNELYSPFVRTGKPILNMNTKSAEVTKYAANALLATRVTFMNEVANFCEMVGADVSEVRQGIGSDSRLGPSFLFPGVGYGGSCFPKDVKALIRTAQDTQVPMRIISAVDTANNAQKLRLVEKVIAHYGSTEAVRGKRFAIWGLSFKPNTDDMREAPSLSIIRGLAALGASFSAYDPAAMQEAERILSKEDIDIEYASSNYQALEGADALIIVTEWNEFRRPSFERIKQSLKEAVVFDGRNIFPLKQMKELGYTYHSIGRSPICPAKS